MDRTGAFHRSWIESGAFRGVCGNRRSYFATRREPGQGARLVFGAAGGGRVIPTPPGEATPQRPNVQGRPTQETISMRFSLPAAFVCATLSLGGPALAQTTVTGQPAAGGANSA